jgi:hypothetical protein
LILLLKINENSVRSKYPFATEGGGIAEYFSDSPTQNFLFNSRIFAQTSFFDFAK